MKPIKLSNGREIRIVFKYGDNIIHPCDDKSPIETQYRRTVGCRIFKDSVIQNVSDLLSYGVAYCQPPDQFVKSKGRKIALKKAVRDFSRVDRTIIWKAYFDSMKHKKEVARLPIFGSSLAVVEDTNTLSENSSRMEDTFVEAILGRSILL